MSTQSINQPLSGFLRIAIAVAALLNILIGLAFLFGPELNINLWPTPVSVELKRFIGAIVLANGIGAAMIVRRGTWENVRVLIMVALIIWRRGLCHAVIRFGARCCQSVLLDLHHRGCYLSCACRLYLLAI